MRIVGCFLEYEDKFLILLRHAHKPDGSTWGLPGGKVEAKESDHEAVRRELEEETGYYAEAEELEHIGNYSFVSSSGQPYVYATYRVRLRAAQPVRLETAAHAEYRWVTPEECDALPNLIPGFHRLLRLTHYIKR